MILNLDALNATKNENLEARRFGKIIYTKEFLETAPLAIQKLFSKIVPVSVEYDFARNVFEVTALCDDFDPVEPMYMIPYYIVNIKTQKRAGSKPAYYISFTKVEE